MTDIEAMKKGYEYIRDKKSVHIMGLHTFYEYMHNCMGYINCLHDLKLITYGEWHALYDFIIDDTEIKVKKY